MRNFITVLTLVLCATASLAALDLVKIATLETAMAPYLGQNDAKGLSQSQEKLSAALKQKPKDIESNLAMGIVEHNLSLALQKKKVTGHPAKAVEALETVIAGSSASNEERTLALSYLGSAWTLWGNEEENPVLKINYVKKGLGILEQAVKLSGGDYYLAPYIRATVSLSLPDFFETLEQAGQDLKLIELALTKRQDYLPAGLSANYYFMLGTYYRKARQLDKAMAAWKKSLAADPKKLGAGKAAAEALDTYGD